MLLTLNHTAATRGGGIGERRVGLARHDSEVLFLLTLESRPLDCERRCATRAVLRCAGEGYRVFVVGDEADGLELMLCDRAVAAAGRAGEGRNLRLVVGLLRPATS